MSSGNYSLELGLGPLTPLSFGSNWTLVGSVWFLGDRGGCVGAGLFDSNIVFSFVGGTNWVLTGDVVGTFPLANLPNGFTPTSAFAVCSAGRGNVSGLCTFQVTMGGVTFTINTTGQNIFAGQSALDLNNDNITIHGHTENFCGDSVSINPGGTNITISGAWTAFAFSWTFPKDGDDVVTGELITITSNFSTDPANSMDLTHVTLSMACGIIVPISQTTDLFTFFVPDSCDGDGLQTLTATGDGTQFSGSVPLGTLTVLLTNGSGIYSVVPGKTNDTYYSSHRDGTTIDIKIPNPTAKTGFIGG